MSPASRCCQSKFSFTKPSCRPLPQKLFNVECLVNNRWVTLTLREFCRLRRLSQQRAPCPCCPSQAKCLACCWWPLSCLTGKHRFCFMCSSRPILEIIDSVVDFGQKQTSIMLSVNGRRSNWGKAKQCR